jgi:hypothetical protein
MESIDTLACATMTIVLQLTVAILCFVPFSRAHFRRRTAAVFDEWNRFVACQNTQTLWLGIPTDEKRRFLRHLFRYWEIIRSRLPPESEAIISTMRDSGQFSVIAGQIHDFVETGEALEVHYIPQGQTTDEFERAVLVINCIGPDSLGREHRDHLAVFFARVGVEVEEGGPGQAGFFTYPHALVAALHRRSQDVTGVNEYVIAPAEGVAFQEQSGLVQAVDDAVSGNVLRRTPEARKSGEQVGLVDDVADGLPGRDHAWPP